MGQHLVSDLRDSEFEFARLVMSALVSVER